MTNILMLSSLVATSEGASDTYTLFPDEPPSLTISHTVSAGASPYTLYSDDDDQLCDSDMAIAKLEQRIKSSNAVFGTALTIGTAGVITTGVGFALVVIGVIPALFGDPGLLAAGSIVAGVGAGVTVIALPVAVTAAFMGNAALRQAGVPSSSVPGWIAIGGLGLTVVGLIVDNGEVITTGIGTVLGGSIAQAIVTNRSFNIYKRQLENPEQAALTLHPYVSLDGYGLGLSGRF